MLIQKTVSEEHTATHITQLAPGQIVEELARMLGGAEITDAVRENAMEMKKLADEWKKLR
jgi:DNA repair protein RecN (Recombination protein N)